MDVVPGQAGDAPLFVPMLDRTLERVAVDEMVGDKAFDGELQPTLATAERLAPRANAREQAYVAAARRWADGDLTAATETWAGIAIAHPMDLLAVQFAQLGDFFLGQSQMLRDRVARVLPRWSRDVPGYGYLLGMHAFGGVKRLGVRGHRKIPLKSYCDNILPLK